MASVIWTESALSELEAIGEFIAKGSPMSANRMVELIRDATLRAAEFPYAGRVIPEISQANHREVFVSSYRIMYRIDGDILYVTAVIHGARDYKPV